MKKALNILSPLKCTLVFLFLLIFALTKSYALDVTLQWDANTEPDLNGYRIYYDTDSGDPYGGTGATEGDSPIDMPLDQDENPDQDIVEFTVRNLQDGTTYFFAVTALDDQGLESDYSNEVNTGATTYTISASAGSGGSISPSGSVSVSYGDGQTFSITPNTGYGISDVLVDGSSVGAVTTYTFSNVTSNHTIAATFATDTYTISATAGSGGSISPSGSVSVSYGDDQTFNIMTNTGYGISDVLVDGSSVGAVTTYTFSNVTGNHTIAATFAADTYTISATSGSGGSISPSGSVSVNYGDDQTFNITPNTGYSVSDVLVDGSSVGALTSYTFSNVTGNHTIAATFAADSYTISATAGSGGSISPSGSVSVNYGDDQTFSITPNTGYGISDVLVDGSSVGAVTSYTFSNVTGNHTIATTFAADTYTITASAGSGGSISPSGSVSVSYGDDQTFNITTNTGYGISDVLVDGSSVGVVTTYTFSNVTTNHTIAVTFGNTVPIANAGPDQTVDEGVTVTLDGSNSSDPDGAIVSYLWSQTLGTTVTLSDVTAERPTFNSPDVGPNGESLTFQLTVTDTGGLQSSDTCIVNVTWENIVPTADAGPDQTVDEGVTVTLDASNSNDPDDGIASYLWTQTEGTTVTLSDTTGAQPTFASPDVGTNGESLTFQLTVTDNGGLQSTDTCIVNVTWQNETPNADAGPDQTVDEGVTVTLDASNSNDPDDGIASYLWTQIEGTTVTLSYTTAIQPTFTSPDVGFTGESLTFQLTVTDTGGLQSVDTCVVNVTWENDPPTAAVTDPSEGSIHTEGDTITFNGSGDDNEDGTLTGSSLVWSSSIDGQIGEGTYFTNSDLSAGTHIITLAVTDSGGATGQDSINLTVEQGDSADSDGDGMPDWWEEQNGLNPGEDDADNDIDDDALDNSEEYQYNTNPNNPDTDNDTLPDGWEVNNGLDPNDNIGENGGEGDFDNDGWTNFEEYANSDNPADDASPTPTLPEIVETIPHDGAGIYDTVRIPSNTSFAVRIQDDDGVNITDAASIQFTITVGEEDTYVRHVGDSDVVRIINLTSEEDTQITELWAVYDRSQDMDGIYPLDTEVNIRVDAQDCRGDWMSQESYFFRVETEAQHEEANDPANVPAMEETSQGDLTTITLVTNDELNGIQIVYNTDEPIKPQVGPYDEIPPLETRGVKSVGYPVNLQPPTVFNNPVTIIIPYNDKGTPGKSKAYMHNGVEWLYACSSYNSHGVVQPDGEGWVVPGSLACNEDADPPTLEIQIYHFSGIQTGYTDTDDAGDDGDSNSGGERDDNSGSAGGCFIATTAYGSPVSSNLKVLGRFRDDYLSLDTLLVVFTNLYEKYFPYAGNRLTDNAYPETAVLWTLWPAIGPVHLLVDISIFQKINILLIFMIAFTWTVAALRRKSVKGLGRNEPLGFLH